MSNFDFQFYPTPAALTDKAWRLFDSRHFERVLDPSGGNGDLLAGAPGHSRGGMKLDAIEIDSTKHPILKDRGITVVGLDFDRLESGSSYSHIIMNPPFAKGCEHVLRAWNVLFDGEIVAIINAETLRNAFSKERQLLVRLIEDHGSVEFIKDAFKGEGVQRQAEVEIALIHLTKRAESSAIVGNILSGLREDASDHAGDVKPEMQLALPAQFVENAVLVFRAAVEAMRQGAAAQAKAAYYSALLGKTMSQRNAEVTEDAERESAKPTGALVRNLISAGYDDLKDRAWASILKSTQVTGKLSSKAQRRLESEFETIKKLEFTEANVYGFLAGLASSGWDITIEMACDVFDEVTRYHSDNAVYFMGWKSNDRHRTCGMRIRMNRFVLPGHGVQSWSSSMQWNTEQLLADIDKVFAMLDGKTEPEVSLVKIGRSRFKDLCDGTRVASSYFDLRFYPGAGTLHFFPTRKDLVDRLNRLVGQHRQWLPPVTEEASPAFWTQFDKAEKFHADVQKHFKALRFSSYSRISDAFNENADHHEAISKGLSTAVAQALQENGIDVDLALTPEAPQPKKLAIGLEA